MPELIASFQVDHTHLKPGIYVSRRDVVAGGYVTTFDVRMKRPNVEPAVHPNAMHTIEHLVATYLRNSEFREHVVYWGPMGCLTGSYFITYTAEAIGPKAIEKLVRAAFRSVVNWRGEVPGTTLATCGNYLLHDLAMAKYEAREFLKRPWSFAYPKTRRPRVGQATFFDA